MLNGTDRYSLLTSLRHLRGRLCKYLSPDNGATRCDCKYQFGFGEHTGCPEIRLSTLR